MARLCILIFARVDFYYAAFLFLYFGPRGTYRAVGPADPGVEKVMNTHLIALPCHLIFVQIWDCTHEVQMRVRYVCCRLAEMVIAP